MTESEAMVVSVDGDHVLLETKARAGCASCGQVAGCGLGDGRGKPLQRMRNTIGARVGDTVSIAVPDGAIWKAALYAYLIPLALTIGGAAGGMSLGGEVAAVLGAAFGLAAGVFVLRQANTRLASVREPVVAMHIKVDVVHHLHRNLEP